MKQKALVTGAGRGIGAACARALARDGFEVFLNYRHSKAEAETLARELGGAAVCADVSDERQVASLFDEIGAVDVLVANAGVALQKLLTDTTADEWRRVFAVNVDGVFHCCKYAIPPMVRQKSGRIITVSSMWGISGASCESAYAASKAAVIGLTRSLARELGPSGITANCVAPGVIGTDMLSALDETAKAALCGETPLGVLGTPEDVAAAVRFLASPAAGFVTGQVFGINGGFLI